QPNDSITSGTVVARRPPNRIAEIGTPAGSSHSGAMIGHWSAGVVNRELGWAAASGESGVQSRPFQSVRCAGGSSVRPSHHTSPSSVRATLVKMLLPHMAAIALALVFRPVPGATPKNPASGLIAYSRPSAPNRIQAMSSPMVSAFHPGMVGCTPVSPPRRGGGGGGRGWGVFSPPPGGGNPPPPHIAAIRPGE